MASLTIISYAEIVFATVPAAPPTRKNQRATSCPAPISAKVPYFAASRLMRSALSCVLGEGSRGTSGPFGGDGGFTAQPARLSVAHSASRVGSTSTSARVAISGGTPEENVDPAV